MGLEVKRIRVTVEGDDSGLKPVESGVDRTTGKTQRLGGVITQALGQFAGNLMTRATEAVVDFAKKAVDGFSDLQQQVANVSSIKPEINTQAVFDSLNEMQTRIPETADKLGSALYNVFSSIEVSQKEGLKLVEDFAKGAVGAVTDAETFGTSIMGVMNAYKLSVKDATHVQDLFFNTVKAGVVSGQELASSLGPVTQAAKAAGQSQEMLFAAIAAVTKEGGPAAQNINNLNNTLQKMSTKEAAKGFHELGVEVTQNGKYRDLVSILTDLKTKLAPLSEEARNLKLQTIFPDAQARQGIQTLLSQLDFLKDTLKTNQTEAGAAAKAYETMSGTFQNQSKILQNSLTAIGTAVTAELMPRITPLMTAFSDGLPSAIKQVKPVIASVEKWFKEALAPIMPVVRDITNFVMQVFGTVVKWFQSNLPLIQKAVQTVFGFIADFWKEWGGVIKEIIGSALNVVMNIVKAALQILTGDFKGAWHSIGEAVKTAVGLVLSLLYQLPGKFMTLAKFVGESAREIANFIITGLVEGVKAGVGAVVGAVTGLASSVIDAFKDRIKARSPSQVFVGIGEDIIAGLQIGLTRGVGVGLIDGTAAWLATSLVNGFVVAYKKALDEVTEKVKAARREFFVAVYGEDSAAVLRMDNPMLKREVAIEAAAEIARYKQMAAAQEKLKADSAAHQEAINEWLRMEMEAANIGTINSQPLPEFATPSLFRGDFGPEFFGPDAAPFTAPIGPINLPLPPRAVRTANTGLMAPKTNDPSRLRAEMEPIFRELGGMAEQHGKRFLSDLLGGRQRGDIFGSLWREMANLGREAITTLIEGSLRKNLTSVCFEVGKRLETSLKASTASVMQVVGAAYQLLAASQRKKQFGLGSILGAVGGFFLGGPAGAISGYNIGNAIDNGDYTGAIIAGVTSYYSGAFKGAGRGGGGGGGTDEDFRNAYKGRSAHVTFTNYGDINNAADLDDLQQGVTDAVQTGLRIVTT